MYKLPKVPGTYQLDLLDKFATDGLISGAAFNPETKELILLGFKDILGEQTPYIVFGILISHYLAKAGLFWLSGIVKSKGLKGWANEIHKKLAEYIKVVLSKGKRDISIITTNYDILIEKALLEEGIEFNYIIDGKYSENGIDLLKMHGSLNWYYCESCHNTNVVNINKLSNYYEDNGIYQIVGLCKECKSTNKLLIVPPTKFKSIYVPLVKIWAEVEKKFDEADVIVFVGYSFDSSDDYITNMLIKSIMKNRDKTIILFNKNPEKIEDFKKHLSVRLDNESESFIKNHLFYYVGDAKEKFVKFMEDIISKMKEEENQKEKTEEISKNK
jgi:NAD-dependent SIR2 family protein deacetylase